MKALLQQALEARKKLDRLGSGQFSTIDDLYNFITAVEKHCEKAEQPQPVAWAMTRSDGLLLDTITPDEHESFEGDYTTPLYTHPQPSKPLSYERISKLVDTCVGGPSPSYPLDQEDWINFTRAVEAAHDIKEQS